MASENREPLIKTGARVTCPANVLKIKSIRVNKGTHSSWREKSTIENRTKGCHITDSINRSSHAHINNRCTKGNRRGISRNTRGIWLDYSIPGEVRISMEE